MESISNNKNNSSNGSSSSRLKQRLAWFFNGSRLLHAACATTSDKALQDPVFVPGPRHRLLGHRSLASSPENRSRGPTLPSIHYSLNCGSCKPTRPLPVTRKKERRVTGTGLDDTTGDQEGKTCPPASPASPSKNSFSSYSFNNVLKEKTKKKKLLSNGYGFTTSSSDDEEFGGFFSSEEGDEQQGKEESETLISSKSFSSDSSEFYHRPSSIAHRKKAINNKISYRQATREGYHQLKHNSSISSREEQTKIKKKKKMRQRLEMDDDKDDDDDEKGENGFAVVKRSKDPYGDFRSSMVEMIVERQMFSGEELEKLLQSYLSLNSQHHHPIILRAFSDIWEALIVN